MQFTNTGILILAFIFGLATTFGSHYMSAWFLSKWYLINNSVMIAVILLSIIQCMCCLVICDAIPVFWKDQDNNVCRLLVKITCHFGSTVLYNYSLVLLEPSSALTIKLLDSITAAFGQRIFQKITMNWIMILSLPVMVCGALLFTSMSNGEFHLNIGVLLAYISNVMLNARNIAISMDINEKRELKQREWKTVAMCVLCILCAPCVSFNLEISDLIPRYSSLLVCVALSAGCFHVSSAYINTFVLLKRLTVLTAAVWNTVKRITVVLLLYCVGSRQASIINFAGLGICFLGLSFYQYGKYVRNKSKRTADPDENKKSEGMNEPAMK